LQAKTLDDVLQIRDQAEALRVYVKAASDSLEAANAAAEIKLRAERKAGEMLAAMEKPKTSMPVTRCYRHLPTLASTDAVRSLAA
jgi:hypothetical protein